MMLHLNAHVAMAQNTVNVPDNYPEVVSSFVQGLLNLIPDIIPISKPVSMIGDETLTVSTRKLNNNLAFSTEPFMASEDDINEFVNKSTQEIFEDLMTLRTKNPDRKIRLVMFAPLLPSGAILNPQSGTPEMTFLTRFTYLIK